ncbi:glucose-6-phosphate dehydrogenase [Phaeodactylibacter xiamenensis]|jgi:glucose-6-phosphate 1-dehydrogenase|uniref:glucose-6-phosphate dehydrogenase n=1 Tax=Phaeodactylibacter xiamenensis TaxID=1524460 RepID=UPI0024A84C87|nr:glucose-6-phosphate dehydrogenase [Phaeodactylibacter xiamenensis]
MDPQVFVIFGASGDLAKRKLLPAIYELYCSNLLPESFAVLGVSRTDYSDDAFRQEVFTDNEFIEDSKKQDFAQKLFYEPIDTLEAKDYPKVRQRLEKIDEQMGTSGNYVFYLSVPPRLYTEIPKYLAQEDLNKKEGSFRRLIIEKPFGYDMESAQSLNKSLQQHFDEDQIYRIDHYLGKETVQNLLVTRFANGIFEPLWNRNYIHHIEITSAEKIGVGDRGGYYDSSGALRDMVQNHLLQIVAHVAMEPPINADAGSIRSEKLKLFKALRPIAESEVGKYAIRGQYIGADIGGKHIKGYREEKGVGDDSMTETYVALKFFIDNWRWAGVPFYIRTGKHLPTKATEVVVYFKSPPHHLFRSNEEMMNMNNQLIMRIQPDEGLLLQFGMKVPGAGFNVKNVEMDFHYSDLTDAHVPEAYERLILDAVKGDATLYARGDSVEEAWRFVDPILNAWKNNPDIKLFGYPAGTWGPDVADNLIEGDRVSWRNPCRNLTDSRNFCEL